MADDNTFAAIAVDLKEENKARKLLKPSFNATKIGPETTPQEEAYDGPVDYDSDVAPAKPKAGQSWRKSSTGIVYWWHGTSWKKFQPDDTEAAEAAMVDSAGMKWNPELHSPNKTKNKDGTWRVKSKTKNAEPVVVSEPSPEPKATSVKKETVMPEVEDEDDVEVEFMKQAEIEIDPKNFIPSIRDALLEQFKHRPKPWSAMSEAEQRDCAHGLEDFATSLVRRIVEEVAAGPRRSIRCLLESYTEKDGIKVAMKVQAFGESESENAVLFLHKARGKNVVVQLASIDELKGDRPAEIMPNQPEIDWDAEPVNPHKGGDDDLAEAAEDAEFSEVSEVSGDEVAPEFAAFADPDFVEEGEESDDDEEEWPEDDVGQ